jgi:hypothetical protein
MKTTLRTFQRDFGRMRQLASRGVTIEIRSKREKFVFAKQTGEHGLLGCCAGLMDSSRLTTEPVGERWDAAS